MEVDPKVVTLRKETTMNVTENTFFLSKNIRPKQPTSRLENTVYARQHTAYIKTKLPKFSNMDDDDAEAEVVKAFSTMVQGLMTIDKGTTIHSWNDRKMVKPLVDGKPLPKT
jgi:hypothetical protein